MCSFVGAAGSVHVAGKVLVWLQFHVLLGSWLYAGVWLCIVMF